MKAVIAFKKWNGVEYIEVQRCRAPCIITNGIATVMVKNLHIKFSRLANRHRTVQREDWLGRNRSQTKISWLVELCNVPMVQMR